MNTAYAGTQAVVRALRLLKLFHGRAELTFAELLAAGGLNRSTTFRILTALASEGMIERDTERDVYRIGPTIVGLAHRASPIGALIERARGEMETLAGECKETITLEMLAGDEVVIVAESISRHVIGALPSLGTSWPARLTSTGKVLLAALDETDREAWIAAHAPADTAFADELARVRDRGWAENYEELEPGFVAAAVPVLDSSGRTVAALSVGGPKQRLTRKRLAALAERLAEAAQRISGAPTTRSSGASSSTPTSGSPATRSTRASRSTPTSASPATRSTRASETLPKSGTPAARSTRASRSSSTSAASATRATRASRSNPASAADAARTTRGTKSTPSPRTPRA